MRGLTPTNCLGFLSTNFDCWPDQPWMMWMRLWQDLRTCPKNRPSESPICTILRFVEFRDESICKRRRPQRSGDPGLPGSRMYVEVVRCDRFPLAHLDAAWHGKSHLVACGPHGV